MKRLLVQTAKSAYSFFSFKPWGYLSNYSWFINDYFRLKKEWNNPHCKLDTENWFPCITDKTDTTPLDYTYFYQNAWAAKKIFDYKPGSHYDVGSHAGFVGIISQYVPTTFIDIRPIDVEMPGLTFHKGSILEMPYKDNSLESLSSICVIEHIGLGRYGDPIDAWGTEKAAKELIRVTKPGGKLIITVPVDTENKVYFNAHRAFTRQYVLEQLFPGCRLMEEKYIYGTRLEDNYQPAKGFGTGFFLFEKSAG